MTVSTEKLAEILKSEGFEKDKGLSSRYTDMNYDSLVRVGWNFEEYTSLSNGKIPVRKITLSVHPEHGINIAVSSAPFERTYHFATGKTVDSSEALRLLKGYCVTTSEGKKYSGE